MAHAGFPNGLNTTPDEVRENLSTNSDGTGQVLIIEIDHTPVGEMNYRNNGDDVASIGIKICEFSYQNKGMGVVFLKLFINFVQGNPNL